MGETVRVEIEGEQFEWDTDKYQFILDKHGIRFEEAALAFFDPNAIIAPNLIDADEARYQLIGSVKRLLVSLTVYTERQYHGKPSTRLISARPLKGKETRLYYQQFS